MFKKLLGLFRRQRKTKKEHCYVPDALTAMNVPEAGELLAERFYELKRKTVPPAEYLKMESPRTMFLRKGIIEQLEEHTPDTLGNLEATLKRGLAAIEAEKKKMAILATPLP